MIKKLTFDEYRRLYKERVVNDFPRMERRPLSSVRKLYQKGRYVCLVLEEEKKFLAYATFLYDSGINCVLLDLYAVDSLRRGGGIGTRFLTMLKEHWSGKTGILLECEWPKAAESEDEKAVRERRIAFYLRAGAEMTPIRWHAFGIDYNVLFLPVEGIIDRSALPNTFLALYGLGVPRFLPKTLLRLELDKKTE